MDTTKTERFSNTYLGIVSLHHDKILCGYLPTQKLSTSVNPSAQAVHMSGPSPVQPAQARSQSRQRYEPSELTQNCCGSHIDCSNAHSLTSTHSSLLISQPGLHFSQPTKMLHMRKYRTLKILSSYLQVPVGPASAQFPSHEVWHFEHKNLLLSLYDSKYALAQESHSSPA